MPVEKLNLLVEAKGLDLLQRQVEALEEEMSSDEDEEVEAPQARVEPVMTDLEELQRQVEALEEEMSSDDEEEVEAPQASVE